MWKGFEQKKENKDCNTDGIYTLLQVPVQEVHVSDISGNLEREPLIAIVDYHNTVTIDSVLETHIVAFNLSSTQWQSHTAFLCVYISVTNIKICMLFILVFILVNIMMLQTKENFKEK